MTIDNDPRVLQESGNEETEESLQENEETEETENSEVFLQKTGETEETEETGRICTYAHRCLTSPYSPVLRAILCADE